MRRPAVALALAAAFPLAHAQMAANNTVEVYGLVDGGYEHVDNGDVSVSRIQSGMSTGSRVGIRGREDLGKGYSAIFTLESRVEIDTGRSQVNGATYLCGAPAVCPSVVLVNPLPPTLAPSVLGGMNAINAGLLDAVSTVNPVNALFDRQAYVGVVTPFGGFLAGRMYTPAYEIAVKYNAFADGFAGSPGQVATINIRANNALQYRAELKGFTLSAMYSFGGTEAERSERSKPPTNGDDFWGIELQYNAEKFGVGAGYQVNRTVTFSQPTVNSKGLETFNIGGNVSVGPVKLFGLYLMSKNDNPVLSPADIQNLVISSGANALQTVANTLGGLYVNRFDVNNLRGVAGPTDQDLYNFSVQWPFGNNVLMGSYTYNKDTSRSAWATADASVQSWALAYMYNFSRRTALYAAYAVAINDDQSRIALGGAGYTGGWTTGTGVNSQVLQIGMRHSF
jgi:GBP family porin